MPVVGLIAGMMLLAIAIGVGGMILVFVVLPAIGVGLFIWLCVYLYQTSQEEERKRTREQELREKQERIAQQEREAIAQQEELLRITDKTNKDNYDLQLNFSKKSGDIFRAMAPTGTGQFLVPISQLPIVNSIVDKMCDPFWSTELTSKNLSADVRDRVRYGAESVGSKENPVWPKDYKGPDPHKVYLPKEWWPIFDELVPFSFSDAERFTHHWCLGHNGTGKTTYLRHLIKYDLERAMRGECSVIVIDSKKLIREMRTLKEFTPTTSSPAAAMIAGMTSTPSMTTRMSSPASNPLILLDADELFPLNPFYLPKKQSRDVMLYMLANLSDASDLQAGALTFLVDAASKAAKPTLHTIRDFFTLKKGQLPDNIDRFSKDTQYWFRHTFANLHPATREGIHQRLTNFISQNEMLVERLNADSFGLDLMKEIHGGGKVLLVDTNRNKFGKEGANVFGRLIIALIDQLSSERTDMDEKNPKPIFIYIDEAQDYIREDERFADILEKARAQNIGIMVAHHHKGQIDARIEQSLNNTGLKTECHDIGHVTVTNRKRTFTLPIDKLEFDHEPQMDRPQYAAMRRQLREKYPYKLSKGSQGGDIEEPTDYKIT